MAGISKKNYNRHKLLRSVLFVWVLYVIAVLFCANKQNKQVQTWDVKARRDMVQNQIVARGIKDSAVIDALLLVERHKFVPESLEKLAYSDHPLPIGDDQTISQPFIVALMTEKLKLSKSDRVLEIGTGSGYQAAILSLLCQEVYTIEIVPSLASSAQRRLTTLGYANVVVRCGDGFLGWPGAAPFDAIIITCAPSNVPEPLIEQLVEGGRLIVPLGEAYQVLTLFTKAADSLRKEEIIPVRFVPMKGLIEE